MKYKKMNLQWFKSLALLVTILVIYKIMSALGVYAIACVLIILTLSLAIYFYLKSDDKEVAAVRKPKRLQIRPYTPPRFNSLKLEQLRSMNPYQFERYVASMYQKIGYSNAYATQGSNDEGRDVIMNDDKTGQLYYVECKRYGEDTVISRPIIQKLQGACSADGAKGIIITTGRYTDPALDFAKKVGIECVRVGQLLEMIEQAEQMEKRKELELFESTL